MSEPDPLIGLRLRTARARLGWSREALAYHSGVSWAGIGQVESGRRRDVRSGTLAALAEALGVTTDYLVLGSPCASMCDHRLLMYSSDEELVAGAGPFLAHAAEHAEAALVVTSKRNIELLRKAVGRSTKRVEFVESSRWQASPLEALNAYEKFCATSLGEGAAWVRIVAELGWADRSVSAARPWIRFDALLNLVFAHMPVSILCILETGSVRPTIARQLSVTHPHGAGVSDSTETDPRALLLES